MELAPKCLETHYVRRDCMSQGHQGHDRILTETVHLNLWEHMDHIATRTGLGPFHVCDSCVVCSVCKAPSNGVRTCPCYLAASPNWITLPSLYVEGEAWFCLYLMCFVQ